GLVRVEQSIPSLSRENLSELPAQVVSVMDRRIQPESAGGRVSMGGVADDEDTTRAESFSDDAFHGPDGHGVNLGCEVGHAQQRLHLCDDLLPIAGVRVAVGMADVEDPFL